MLKTRFGISIIAATAACASADVVSPSAADLSIFAGGTVSFGDRVSTSGSIGAGSRVSLGHDNTVVGDIYSTNGFSADDRVDVTGAIVSNSSISVGSESSVSGAMNAGTSVWIGAHGSYSEIIAGTSFSADIQNSIYGSINAGTSFWMDNGTLVTGDINYGTTYSAANSAQVQGTIGTSPASPSSWSSPTFPQAFTMNSGGSKVWIANGASSQISDGAHGSFSTGANATLSFGSGSYSFDSFYAGDDTTLVFDTSGGDVVLYSSANFSTGDRVEFVTNGQGRVIVNAANGIWIGDDSQVSGTFQAINGRISIGDGVGFDGTLTAGTDIWIGHDSAFTSTVIPAPSAMAILGITGLVGASRRRR